jgi:hypothetical protein
MYIANPCPKCGAEPWRACHSSDGNRVAMHQSRKIEIKLEPIRCGRNIQTYSLPPCENIFTPSRGREGIKRFCSGRCNRLYHAFTWAIEDPERRKKSGAKSDKKYYERTTKTTPEELEKHRANKIKIAGVSCQPEYKTVASHYRLIFKSPRREAENYKSMPFFDGWNPNKSGSFRDGYDWIIKNIGPRPKGTSLHVVKHEIGFVPGNLAWAHPRKQSAEQMFKIIAELRHENKKLKAEICELKLNYSPGPNVPGAREFCG